MALRLQGQQIYIRADGNWEVGGLTEDLTPDWNVKFSFGKTQSGKWTIARVEVCPWHSDGETGVPDGGITMGLLRRITIDAVRRFVDLKNSSHTTARRLPLRPVRRRAPTQQQLREYLARYTHLINAKDPSPAKTLAAELQQPRSTVRTWLRRAKAL